MPPYLDSDVPLKFEIFRSFNLYNVSSYETEFWMNYVEINHRNSWKGISNFSLDHFFFHFQIVFNSS